MKNPLKRTDVFQCNYKDHSKFENRVSVYHVLRSRKCFPQGCVGFSWYCDLLNKGKSCPRGFQFLGRLCEGCSHYSDEKVHYQPQLKLSDQDYEIFKQELEDFDDWIYELENRQISLFCRVDGIKPCFKKEISAGKFSLRLDGYILVLKSGFIDTTEFDDYFYIHISPRQQEQYSIAYQDVFEARGIMTLDRGRLVFPKIWTIDFEERSGEKTWTNSEARVARQVATFFPHQPQACLHCTHGALVDVKETKRKQTQLKRELYCLKGISDYRLCYLAAKEHINECIEEIN